MMLELKERPTTKGKQESEASIDGSLENFLESLEQDQHESTQETEDKGTKAESPLSEDPSTGELREASLPDRVEILRGSEREASAVADFDEPAQPDLASLYPDADPNSPQAATHVGGSCSTYGSGCPGPTPTTYCACPTTYGANCTTVS